MCGTGCGAAIRRADQRLNFSLRISKLTSKFIQRNYIENCSSDQHIQHRLEIWYAWSIARWCRSEYSSHINVCMRDMLSPPPQNVDLAKAFTHSTRKVYKETCRRGTRYALLEVRQAISAVRVLLLWAPGYRNLSLCSSSWNHWQNVPVWIPRGQTVDKRKEQLCRSAVEKCQRIYWLVHSKKNVHFHWVWQYFKDQSI